MVNILVITSGLTAGGVDSLLLNTLSVMNKNKYHLDILIFDDSPCDWEEKFIECGCKVLKMKRARSQGVIHSVKNYIDIIRNGNYQVVHSHIGYGSILPVIACSFVKKSKIMTHAHFDAYQVGNIQKKIGQFIFNHFQCERVACSYGAGKALYGDNSEFVFAKNGIDTKKYAFNLESRKFIRNELQVDENTFVIGTVGRMQYQKNHEFLLDIFKDVLNENPNSVLVLVGDGELKDSIKEKAKKLSITDKIIFLGIRNDVDKILQAFDVFVMPTRFEGLSLALLEVQSSGLPCITSDVVPKEAKVLDNFEFVSLNKSSSEWASIILSYRNQERTSGADSVYDAGFDKNIASKTWFELYDKIAK